MNILITAPSLNPTKNVSGVATVVNTIIEYNRHHSYFHYLLGRPDKSMNKFKWVMQLLGQLSFFPSYVKRNEIEMVHQNLPFDPKGLLREYIINLWCRIMGIPVVLHIHGGVFLMNRTSNPIFRMLSKALFKHSKQVVVLSDLERQALVEKYNYCSAVVLCNSIDTAKYKFDQKVLKGQKPVLLFLGRIHESKGIEDILEAFRLLKHEMDFRFILCGAGPLKDNFVDSCMQTLGADFEFMGIVSGQDKINVIKEAEFFLLPSRYGEGLPMALLETMAAGIVPIVTNDASMKFVVQHKINGIRVNKRDPQDLFEKLQMIITDSELYQTLSINAQKTVIDQYDISNFVIQLNEIYNTAIQ